MEKDTLYKYFARQLSTEERRTVREWVEASPENLEEFMQARALFDATVLHVDSAPAVSRTARKFWYYARRTMQAAAVAAVTLFGTWLYQKQLPTAPIPMQSISVPSGQQLHLTLADGTDVWLNSESTLTYPVIFSGNTRDVEIDGKGFFKVTHDESKPFTVKTCRGEIEVLGTSFDVDAYSKSSEFATTLFEGKVKLGYKGQDYVLAPNEVAHLDKSGAMKISPNEDANNYRWTEGIISLHNDSFESIMKKFEKFFGVKIQLGKDFSDNVNYSGSFYISDGVVYALNIMRKDLPFSYTIDQDKHIINIK